jgi:ribosomal protein S18 acetylase RimI-like enzyme
MTSDPVDVRPATAADVPAVTALLLAQLLEHRMAPAADALRASVERVLADPARGRIFVAADGARPVGVAALSFSWPLEHAARVAWLEELYVEPAARERGIGTRLLRAALAAAREAGVVAVELEVDVDHRRAARLYEREGFRPLPRARWTLPVG